jgi:hypothetical protein
MPSQMLFVRRKREILHMLRKIERETCLKEYPEFPLYWYFEETDEEKFFYPDVIPGEWIWLHTGSEMTDELPKELTQLINAASIKSLVFLSDTDRSWITELSLSRKDYQPLTDALNYFIDNGIDSKFIGGVEVSADSLYQFLIHFYTLVSVDGSFPGVHFIDSEHQFVGTIHYSGQVKLDSLNENADILVQNLLSKSKFKPVKS